MSQWSFTPKIRFLGLVLCSQRTHFHGFRNVSFNPSMSIVQMPKAVKTISRVWQGSREIILQYSYFLLSLSRNEFIVISVVLHAQPACFFSLRISFLYFIRISCPPRSSKALCIGQYRHRCSNYRYQYESCARQ